MKKIIALFLLLLLSFSVFTGCIKKAPSDAMKITQLYINGFFEFYESGNEYTEQGLQIQADYAYGWAAASISSMRYCVDCLLYLGGEGKTLDDVVDGRRADWDDIAALNYASPYPWFFEGLVYHAQDKKDAAVTCYEKAIVYPSFDAENSEALMALAAMKVYELKAVKAQLTEMEDQIFAVYKPELNNNPRELLSFSDQYLRAKARETLESDPAGFKAALRYYEAALAVNPFEGDNFAGCALMCLYLDDIDRLFFYVNEGLFVDPENEGLNQLASMLNEEASLS